MARSFSVADVFDGLIGWSGATPATRTQLLRAFCSGIKLHSLISNSATLLILGGLIIAQTRAPSHALWLLLVVLGGMLPRGYALHLRREQRFEEHTERKALIFVAISAVYGLLWGLGPFLLLPDIDGAMVGILLVILVFGTIMGPYATMPGILYVRMATTGIPTFIAVALHTTPAVTFVSLVLGAWLVLRTDIWRGYHRTLRQQFELRQELEQAYRSKEAANLMLKQMAETDPLTGTANRRQFMQRLGSLRGPAALVLFDIDHFKAVNDSYGHEVGDAVLVELSCLVQEVLREDDLLARIGGEEFAIILSNVEPSRAWTIAERVRERVEAHRVQTERGEVRVTLSLGIATVAPEAPPGRAAALLRKADLALYAAKRKGRNRTHAEGAHAD